ncbi:MAG: hypothetical protein ACHBN1_00485 [Heteroscytonema crispum UTEX LB 1556]
MWSDGCGATGVEGFILPYLPLSLVSPLSLISPLSLVSPLSLWAIKESQSLL